jgi:hypothetical protein
MYTIGKAGNRVHYIGGALNDSVSLVQRALLAAGRIECRALDLYDVARRLELIRSWTDAPFGVLDMAADAERALLRAMGVDSK